MSHFDLKEGVHLFVWKSYDCSTTMYNRQNWQSFFGNPFRHHGQHIGQYYVIAGYLHLFDKAPDKRPSFGESAFTQQTVQVG